MFKAKYKLHTLLTLVLVFNLSVLFSAENKGVRFIENKGQIADMSGNARPDILGEATDAGTQLFLRKDGITYVMYRVNESKEDEDNANQLLMGHRVDATFVGSNSNVTATFINPTPEHYNYYLQHCSDGITYVKAYNNVVVKNIYNNIDVSYYGEHKGKIKYDFIVNPGGNVNNIKINYSGAQSILLDKDRLTIETSIGNLGEWMPTVYQEINGDIKKINAHYTLTDNIVGIEVGNYDHSLPLIIDPWVTYLGGAAAENGLGITVSTADISTMTGHTSAPSFPISVGAFQVVSSSLRDAFISSFDPNGNLLFSTFYGGTGNDVGSDVVVNSATGDIFFAGSFASAGMSSAPATSPFQPAFGGGIQDMLIAKFSATGVRQWATYYGKANDDKSTSIALFSNGDLGIAGTSTGGLTLTNPHQNIYGGVLDAVVLRMASNGQTVSWSTYYGGSATEYTGDIDIDNADHLILSGTTNSPNNIGTPFTHQPSHSGNSFDAFVVKFNSTGIRQWGTYLGGAVTNALFSASAAPDWGAGVACNNNGDITVTGTTGSADFPTTPGSYKSVYSAVPGNSLNSFLSKLKGANGTLDWSTYFEFTEGYSVAIDKTNELVYLHGGTYTSTTPCNWSCAYQATRAGSEDFYIAKINNRNGYPICNTFLGGSDHEDILAATPYRGGCLALNGYSVYASGSTLGNNFPVTPGAFQPNWASSGGVYDACIFSICGFSCGNNTLAPTLSASKTNLCKEDAINFTDLSVLCDTAKANFLWTFSGAVPSTSTNQNPTNIRYNNFGTFDVKLVITTPCGSDSVTYNNYIKVVNPIAMISSVTNVTCFGFNNGGSTVGAIGGTSPYNYSWNTGVNTSSISNLTAGTYSVTVTDVYGCTSATTTNITQPAVLTATAIVTNSISCFGGNNGSLSVNVTGGTPSYSYSWSSSATTTSVSSLSTGNYFITVTDNYGCTATSIPVNIPEPALLTVNTVGDSALCNGQSSGSATAIGNGGVGGYTYTWSSGSATSSAPNLAAGIYTVSVTDANGCISSNTVIIAQPSALSLTVTAIDAHCNQSDGSANVNVNGGTAPYFYLWNTNVTTSTLPNVPAGNYSITVTDSHGCSSSAPKQINNLSGVTASIQASSPASCNGACDGWAIANATSGNSPYNYSWSNTVAASSASNLCVGTFSVIITDADGCTGTASVTISQPAAISATLTSNNVSCFGEINGNISVANTNGGNGVYNYSWSNGGVGNNIANIPAGLYTVTITDGNGCTGTSATNITSPTQLIINTSPDISVCAGTSVTLAAMANGGTPAYNFLWNNGTNNAITTFTPNTSGNFSVTVTDANNCTAIGNIEVTVWSLPVISFNADVYAGCGPLCVNFSNTTPNANTSAWNFGDGTSGNGTNPNHCYNTPGSYHISLTVTNNNGCSNTLTTPNFITVHPNPTASFVMTPQNTTILNPTISFTDKSRGATSWNWTFGDLTNASSTIQHPSFTYPSIDTGSYIVTLMVTNEFGCTGTAQDIVYIKGDYALYVPNTFTPNGDGKNEIFIPAGVGLKDDTFEMMVFDRWGNLIFKSNDAAIGWDGKLPSNETAQQDVYVWKVNTRDQDNRVHRYTGHISLIR